MIAGEASGDEHAARLVRDLKARSPGLAISALGGKELEQSGAELLFRLADHAVVGLFEVLKNYSFFRSVFARTIDWINRVRPKCVLLVDYPGFNLRLARELRARGISSKGGGEVRILQYVSPQLWAWKPKRRFMMSEVLDGLGIIFPFEKECYSDVSLPVAFVGHPFAHPDYRSPFIPDARGPLLLLPGSRVQAVGRILPVFLDACERLLDQKKDLTFILPLSEESVRSLAQGLVQKRPQLSPRLTIVNRVEDRTARAALMSSGTMSLACAWAGIPGVIGYRAHPFTYLLGKMLVGVPYLGMANLLMPENPPNPEFLQGRASGSNLARAVGKILEDEASLERAGEVSTSLRSILSGEGELGTVDWVLQAGRLD